MFEKGDYIVHGSHGVCQVEGVTKLDMSGVDKNRLYYVLCPVNSKGSKMYSPVDNNKVISRPVLSSDEAMELIDDIPNIEQFVIVNDKMREIQYKDAIRACDCRELVRIIKTLYYHKQERLACGKKSTSIDEKYFQIAEDNLYSELAISMGKEKNSIEAFIAERMERLGNK